MTTAPTLTEVALSITIPGVTPPREATKNWHGHWSERSKAVRSFRIMSHWAIYEAIHANGQEALPDTLDLAVWVRWPKGQRRFDDDGIRSAIAPLQDELRTMLNHASDHRYKVLFVEQTHAKRAEDVGMTIEVRLRETA